MVNIYDVAVWIALIVVSLPIIIADLSSHKIPNIYLTYGLLLATPYIILNGFGSIRRLVAICLVLACCGLLGLGMGDIKLMGLFAITLNSGQEVQFESIALLILILATLHILLQSAKDRRIVTMIPMAPSIITAVTVYLASR